MSDVLVSYGLNDRWQSLADDVLQPGQQLARVTRQDRGFVLVITEQGQIQVAVPVSLVGSVVVGDWVVVDDTTVKNVLERTSLLTRRDPLGVAEQPLAANVDLVLVVCGVDRPLKSGRIERSIAQAYDAGAMPMVVLTKSDLADDLDSVMETLSEQVPLVEIVPVSSKNEFNIKTVQELIAGKTSVMIGESGAGKSTLLNRLVGSEVTATGSVRSGDNKGKHTTTRREMFVVPTGGVLIDTPGLRSVGLSASAEAVDNVFADIAELAQACRFSNCTHTSEPGCAVLEAVSSGTIAASRVDAWQTLQKEVVAEELRRNTHLRHATERKFGRMVDEALKFKQRRNDK